MAEMHKYQTKEILNKILNSGETAITTAGLPATVTTDYTEATGSLNSDITTIASTLYGIVITVEQSDSAGASIIGNIVKIRNDATDVMEIMITKDKETIQFFPGLGMSLSGGINLKSHSANENNCDYHFTTYYTT
jgi:hypothetical protein